MAKIKKIIAREILDGRGWPTLEVLITAERNLSAKASVPSGSISGNYEAWDLLDGDMKRYQGYGVLKAVDKINNIIAPALQNKAVDNQIAIDNILNDLDSTANKKDLGANSLLAVSLAAARLGALNNKQELFVYLKNVFSLGQASLPQPIFDIFNGGKYADTNLDFQEFLLIPKLDSASNMLRMGAEIYHELGIILREAGYDTDIGLEGGYAPNMDSSLEALELIMAAALRLKYQPGKDIFLGLDIGSAVLYQPQEKQYLFSLDHNYFSSANLIGLYEQWLKKYPLIYLEDGLAPDDWSAWRELTAELGGKIILAGDELFATNPVRLSQALKEKAANAVVIKPSQAATLTATIDYAKLAQKHHYKLVVSQRGGETNDSFITDLAVALGAQYLKAGSLSRGERIAKYNRLLAIDQLIS